MRTHNNIHRSPLHIQITKIVRSNLHDFVPCMAWHGNEEQCIWIEWNRCKLIV
jgi:hypothetical protein